MFKIQTLNKISATGLAQLGEGFTISDNEANPDAIILRSFKMHDMELPGGLLAVARAGAGVNNIPIDKCSEKGIVVFNTPGANANAVKELVICGLMLSSRKVWQGINWAQTLKGKEDVPALVEKGKGDFGGVEILGKTMGIIGVGGAIGVLTANACNALGMKVIGSDPYLSDKAKAALDPAVTVCNLDEVLAKSDYISINVPYSAATKHMINAEALKKCKKGVVVLNFARAELVDDAALKAALAEGSVSVYVTDFPNSEHLDVENIIAIPHLGASSEEAEENCALMAAAQTRDFLQKGNIVNSVNFPALSSDTPGKLRSGIVYKADAENAVGARIKAEFAAKNDKFEFNNAVRGNYGYALVVFEGDSCNGACDVIRAMPEVIMARSIR
ncbi:MAG: 3-phosphoglycerate dehydrogenase [Defluviitaleaceae bacterium]|nr:3-phosphoglycerate dehydrogenase [Defluviitaleaceae bacterium]